MNNEQAIEIIRKEYKCVDRDCDIERSCGKCELNMPNKEPILQAYKMAIKALSQEPRYWINKDGIVHKLVTMELVPDAVSRQEVLELAYDMSEIDGEHFTEPCMVVDVEDIQNLPSVTQKSTECDAVISRILTKMWNCRGKRTTSIDKVAMEQIIRDELSSDTSKPIELARHAARE